MKLPSLASASLESFFERVPDWSLIFIAEQSRLLPAPHSFLGHRIGGE
jgi:hypothetical protein